LRCMPSAELASVRNQIILLVPVAIALAVVAYVVIGAVVIRQLVFRVEFRVVPRSDANVSQGQQRHMSHVLP